MKREAQLKSAFLKELTKQFPSYLILQYATLGAPDREIVGGGRSSRWEFKHGTPSIQSQGAQALACARLAAADHCRYVIWQETTTGIGHRTLIVHPLRVLDGTLTPEIWTTGYDHRWLVEQVRKYHEFRRAVPLLP
jgi:hypothetical protein